MRETMNSNCTEFNKNDDDNIQLPQPHYYIVKLLKLKAYTVNVRPYFSKKTSRTTDVMIFLLSNTFNVHFLYYTSRIQKYKTLM